jgi:hypothetical protein
VLGTNSCNVLLSCVVMYFANLYLGLSFQVTIWQIGFCCFCTFMASCMSTVHVLALMALQPSSSPGRFQDTALFRFLPLKYFTS